MNGKSGLMSLRAICKSTAFSGNSNACVGRLWQSMQSIERCSPFSSCSLVALMSRGDILDRFSFIIRVVDNRNDLALIIDGDVVDARAFIQMAAVNADGALPRVAAHFQQQDCGVRRVFLIFLVRSFHDELVPREALRPMAVLARFPRRPQKLYRRGIGRE